MFQTKPFIAERRRPGGAWRAIHDTTFIHLYMKLGHEIRFIQDYWCNA